MEVVYVLVGTPIYLETLIAEFSMSKRPRINTEDITYVSVAEKVAELDAKINLMNDAIASNTVRSTNNSDTIKSIMSSTPCQ